MLALARRTASEPRGSNATPMGDGLSLSGGTADQAAALHAAIEASDAEAAWDVLASATTADRFALLSDWSAETTRWFLSACKAAGRDPAILEDVERDRVVDAAQDLSGNLQWTQSTVDGVTDADGNGKPDFKLRTESQRPFRVNYKGLPAGRSQTTNDFAVWMLGGPEPTMTSKMCCWEGVLFSAWRGGLVDYGWLVDLHHRMSAAGEQAVSDAAYAKVLEHELRVDSARALSPEAEPLKGDLLFFGGLNHVALSLGTETPDGQHEMMSLWFLPVSAPEAMNIKMQRTTVEKLVPEMTIAGVTESAVTFNTPSWI